MRKHTFLSVCLHCFNWLQTIRLLATRGHYSIDLIIGYVVAVFVSSPAERLGLCYSHGISPALPRNIVETFEILVGVGVSESNEYQKVNGLNTHTSFVPDSIIYSHDDQNNVQSETSVRVAWKW